MVLFFSPIQLKTAYFYLRRWALLETGTESVCSGHAVVPGGGARAWARGEGRGKGQRACDIQHPGCLLGAGLSPAYARNPETISEATLRSLLLLVQKVRHKVAAEYLSYFLFLCSFYRHDHQGVLLVFVPDFTFWYIYIGKFSWCSWSFLDFSVSLTWDCNSLLWVSLAFINIIYLLVI